MEHFSGQATWIDGRLKVHGTSAGSPYTWTSEQGPEIMRAGEFHTVNGTRPELADVHGETLTERLGKLTGGFAVARFDPDEQAVTLATDAFGIRPLYYAAPGNGRLFFSTRLEDVARANQRPLVVNWLSVYHYLNFSYIPGPETIYRGVFVLPPGAAARCRDGKVDVATYWDLSYPADAEGSDEELARVLRNKIEYAVLQAIPSDLPPEANGTFLSGGTDSGTIAGIASRSLPRLKAYSIAFNERAYDEIAYAQLLAESFGLDHRVHYLSSRDLIESIPILVRQSEQPLGNPSLVGAWQCAKLAAESGVRLLLAGDGGDELFGGNERYRKDRVYSAYHSLPAFLRRFLLELTGALPVGGLLRNRLHNFAYRGDLPNPARFYADDEMASRWWDALMSSEFAGRVWRTASLELLNGYYGHAGAKHELDRLLYLDLKTAIWGNDLVKVTSAARMAGVRVRFPFLDQGLAAFTGRLHPRHKLRGLNKRYLFKRAVRDVLPAKTLNKPKHGFGLPISHWIRYDAAVRAAVLDPLLDPRSRLRDVLRPDGLRKMIDQHLRSEWDYGMWLWALMMLDRWLGDHGVVDASL